MTEHSYLPAAGRDLFLPLYDPLTRLLGFQKALATLLDQAALTTGLRVLDVGCGTGTVLAAVKRRHPDVEAVGLDPDPKALERAQRKARRAGVAVRFERGFGDALPFRDGAFDRVFSSMMFHHVPRSEKPRVLAEIRRVLAPGGRLEFLDLAPGGHRSLLARLLHGPGVVEANADDRLIRQMRDAGFANARRLAIQSTLVGPIAFYQASIPGE